MMTDITPTQREVARTNMGLLARIVRAADIAIRKPGPSSACCSTFIVIMFLAFGPLKGTLENKS